MTCALIVLLTGCGAGAVYVEPDAAGPANLFQSSYVFADDAGPLHSIIRSQRDWEELLATYPTDHVDYARERFLRVDYSRHMVVGTALGTRWNANISVHVDSLREEGQRMVVYRTEYRPLMQSGEQGNPAHFIVVERTNLPVEFEDVTVMMEREE